MDLSFTKMHGAGNDFVVLDRRADSEPLPRALIARMADRHLGVGFDQLLTIERATSAEYAARYSIWNADGSPAQQCGNGVRCLVAWLTRDSGVGDAEMKLEGPAGVVACRIDESGVVHVDMGMPRFDPAAVGFEASHDALSHPLRVEGRDYQIGVASMGNPHAVLVVEDVVAAPVETLGPLIETHPRFADRCNVGFAEIAARDSLRLRVFERGVGETLACGSGACAAVAVLRRRDLLDACVAVALPGGTLTIAWPGAGSPLWMSGPAAFVFEGTWNT